MHSKEQFCNLIFRTISRAATVALAMSTVFALTVVLAQSVQAQTFQVIHTFTGGADGAEPQAGLTIDAAGNLYGTTFWGGRSRPGWLGRVRPKNWMWHGVQAIAQRLGLDANSAPYLYRRP